MHELLVTRLGGLSLPRKTVVRLTDRPDTTLDVYRGRKTTMQQQQQQHLAIFLEVSIILWITVYSDTAVDFISLGQNCPY